MTERDMIFHICRTGTKEQFYTLYIECQTYYSYGGVANWLHFVQNLAHTRDDAVAKATEISKEHIDHVRSLKLEIWNSPRPLWTQFHAFGTQFKLAKSKKVWYAFATEQFWEQWRTRKDEIKDFGFWVNRNDDGDWMIFKRVIKSEIKYAKEA